MSHLRGSQEGTVFLVGQVSQSVGDYLACLERYEEAKEEYKAAIAAYNQVHPSSPDFVEAKKNKDIVLSVLDKLPERREPSDAYKQVLSLAFDTIQPHNVSEKKLVNLGQWLENVFEESWQTIEELFGQKQANLAFALRVREVAPESPDTIKNLIQLIYTSPDEHRRQEAAQRLGGVGIENSDAVAALIHLLHTTTDEETRWAAAESLWVIDPGNPAAGVRRVTNLGMQMAGHAVVLMVAVLVKADQNADILVRVYPLGGQTYLLPELQLSVVDEFNKTFLETQAREEDNYIQLKFGVSWGERFSVRVTLGEVGIAENFVI